MTTGQGGQNQNAVSKVIDTILDAGINYTQKYGKALGVIGHIIKSLPDNYYGKRTVGNSTEYCVITPNNTGLEARLSPTSVRKEHTPKGWTANGYKLDKLEIFIDIPFIGKSVVFHYP